jgi:hypothetical protein
LIDNQRLSTPAVCVKYSSNTRRVRKRLFSVVSHRRNIFVFTRRARRRVNLQNPTALVCEPKRLGFVFEK